MKGLRYVELIPLSPKIPLKSRQLKLRLSKIFREKLFKPKDKITSLGYPFIVSKVSGGSDIRSGSEPEIKFINSSKRFFSPSR
ncbi:MAG: hypothetical protein ACTSUE_16110 [Promethearchaeota archaeon]